MYSEQTEQKILVETNFSIASHVHGFTLFSRFQTLFSSSSLGKVVASQRNFMSVRVFSLEILGQVRWLVLAMWKSTFSPNYYASVV